MHLGLGSGFLQDTFGLVKIVVLLQHLHQLESFRSEKSSHCLNVIRTLVLRVVAKVQRNHVQPDPFERKCLKDLKMMRIRN